MDYAIARRRALRLLSMRNYHSEVLKRKLIAKGATEEIAERVLEDCKRMGFLQDDEAILREFRRGLGPRAIACKLRLELSSIQRLISRSMQREKILQLWPKWGTRDKAFRSLQRRGFDLDILIEILSNRGVD